MGELEGFYALWYRELKVFTCENLRRLFAIHAYSLARCFRRRFGFCGFIARSELSSFHFSWYSDHDDSVLVGVLRLVHCMG